MMNVRDLEELCRKIGTGPTQFIFLFGESINWRIKKIKNTERIAENTQILIFLLMLYRIKLYIIVQILQLE